MVDDLLEGHQPLGLQAHIDDQMLVSLLDDRAGDNLVAIGLDGGGFGGLLALKGFQGGGKIVHGLEPCSMGLLRLPAAAARQLAVLRLRPALLLQPLLGGRGSVGYRLGWGIGVQRGVLRLTSAVSGLDVDSCDGCSSSVAGSRVGVSNSVFRVMLSGSGLRTFAITAAPGFLAPAARLACRWAWLPALRLPQRGMP